MKEPTNRLQVELTPEKLAEVEELRRLGGLKSKRELWDTAFTLLKWAVKKKAHGAAIGSLAAHGDFVELEMPFLEHYASNAERQQSGTNPEAESRNTTKAVIAKLAARSNGAASSISSRGRKKQTA